MDRKEKEQRLLRQYLPRDLIVSLAWLVILLVFAVLAFADLKGVFLTRFGLEWSRRDQFLFTVVLVSYLIWGLPFHTWRRFIGTVLDLITGPAEITCQLPYQFGGGYRKYGLPGRELACNSVIPHYGLGPREIPTKGKNCFIYFQAPWTKWHVDNRICDADELYGSIQSSADKGKKYTITYLRRSRMIVDIVPPSGKPWSIDDVNI